MYRHLNLIIYTNIISLLGDPSAKKSAAGRITRYLNIL